jgi:hypothetical protein
VELANCRSIVPWLRGRIQLDNRVDGERAVRLSAVPALPVADNLRR